MLHLQTFDLGLLLLRLLSILKLLFPILHLHLVHHVVLEFLLLHLVVGYPLMYLIPYHVI